MKVTFVEDPTPHLLLEDVYSEDQLSTLWKEIEILTPSLDPPSETGSAWHEDDEKTLKKQNKGLFLYNVYNRRDVSPIISITEQILFNDMAEHVDENHWITKVYKACNWNTLLLSYYQNNNYYEPHTDLSTLTCLIWLWKEPKKFSGGNLTLTNYDHTIECKNNTGIIFFGGEEHAVNNVTLDEEYIDQNLGRYTISTFMGTGRAD